MISVKQTLVMRGLVIAAAITGALAAAQNTAVAGGEENPMEVFQERVASDAIMALNGPTGWVETTDGNRYRMLRIGDFEQRHVVVMPLADTFEDLLADGGYRALEDMKRIEFYREPVEGRPDSYSPMWRVVDRDGTVYEQSRRSLWSPDVMSYGAGQGFPVVVEHPDQGEPITKRFPNFRGLSAIELDSVSQWGALEGGSIASDFNLRDEGLIEAVLEAYRARAVERVDAAREAGRWPNEWNRETEAQWLHEAQHHLEARYSAPLGVSSHRCAETIETGVEDLQAPAPTICALAQDEIRAFQRNLRQEMSGSRVGQPFDVDPERYPFRVIELVDRVL